MRAMHAAEYRRFTYCLLLAVSCVGEQSTGNGPSACIGGELCVGSLVCVDGFCVEPSGGTESTSGEGDGDDGDGDGDDGDGDGDDGDGDGDDGDGDGDGDACPDGTVGCECLPSSQCDRGLSCIDGVCLSESCGNGVVEPGEDCDDGNDIADDACTNVCALPACGDGIVHDGEACDDQNASNEDACLTDCSLASCGDGFVHEGVEDCDDGNNIDNDECLEVCESASCGDGYVQEGVEDCDDGNLIDTDECTNACVVPVCGNMSTEGVEECDDGNMVNTDACIDCMLPECGDGFAHIGVEECDDGNFVDNDGCTSTCLHESKIVFVTSTMHTGNLGGLAGADAICNARAQAANLPGTYMAWLSTDEVDGTPAQRSTQSTQPFLKVNGVQVAEDWTDLTGGTLDSPIDMTETGGPAPVTISICNLTAAVWTNTHTNGTLVDASQSCGNWTMTNGGSHWGFSNTATSFWTHACMGGSCGWQAPIYCLQQ